MYVSQPQQLRQLNNKKPNKSKQLTCGSEYLESALCREEVDRIVAFENDQHFVGNTRDGHIRIFVAAKSG